MKHLFTSLGLLGLLGCPNVEPCNSIEDGDAIEVTLVGDAEAYFDDEPLPSCGGADQPPARSVLKMSNGVEQSNCLIPGCPADYPSPSEPFLDGIVPGTGREWACTRLYRKVRIDECDVRRDVAIRRTSSGDFFSPSSTVVLIRRLSYASGGELQCDDPLAVFPPDAVLSSEDTSDGKAYWCSDAWVVKLKRK